MKSEYPSATIKDLPNFFRVIRNETVKEAEVLYSFKFESTSNPVFALYGDYIVKLDSGGIWFLDKKGQVIWSKPIAMGDPILKVNGSKLLAADAGSGEIYVLEGRSVVWEDKADEAILNADINKKGYVTVVTESKSYNNEIRVYDPYGIELIRKVIANAFVVSALVSPSGKTLVVSGISAGTTAAYSNYKIYDLEGNELLSASFSESGEMLPVFWFGNDNIFAAGDRAVALLDKENGIVWEKQFDNIAGAAPYKSNGMVAAAKDDEGYRLVLISASGEELATCRLEEKPAGLNVTEGLIAVNANNTVNFFNNNMAGLCKFTTNRKVDRVLLIDRHKAVIMTGNEAFVVNIN